MSFFFATDQKSTLLPNFLGLFYDSRPKKYQTLTSPFYNELVPLTGNLFPKGLFKYQVLKMTSLVFICSVLLSDYILLSNKVLNVK